MKTLAISAVTVFGLLATTQVADAASYTSSSKKQTVKFSVTGDCKGEEEMIEDESEDNCKIVVKISPSTPTRSAVLEQLNEDDEWDQVASAKSKAGKITFSIDAYDEDDLWLDGDFTFQVSVKKSGTNKAVVSDEYTFTFTPAESEGEDEEEGSGEASSKQKGKSTGNTKLDAVMDNLDDKNTKYDDGCTKSFGADCKLMFTPTGPNWAKLTTAKWQSMCVVLLRQSTANCKLMYGSSAPPLGSPSGEQPSGGSGGQPPSGGSGVQPPSAMTSDTIKKACTTAGVADCTAIVQLMMDAMSAGKIPDGQAMGKLLGNKMDAFFKALPPMPSSGGSSSQPK